MFTPFRDRFAIPILKSEPEDQPKGDAEELEISPLFEDIVNTRLLGFEQTLLISF